MINYQTTSYLILTIPLLRAFGADLKPTLGLCLAFACLPHSMLADNSCPRNWCADKGVYEACNMTFMRAATGPSRFDCYFFNHIVVNLDLHAPMEGLLCYKVIEGKSNARCYAGKISLLES